MFYYFEKYYKPILFTIVNCIGLIFLQNIRHSYVEYYSVGCVLYLIISTWLLYLDHKSHQAKQATKPLLFDNTIHLSDLIQHYILPLWLIVSLLTLIFINQDRLIGIFYIAGASVTLLFCYININAYFENYYLIEKRTHLVYDFIKIFIFIVNSNILLNYFTIDGSSMIALYTAFVSLTFFLIFLIAFRNYQDLRKTCLRIIIGCTLIVLSLYWCLVILHLGVIQTNITVVILFYMISAYIHHDIEGTLTLEVFTEYLIWLALMITVVWSLA